MNKYQRLAVKHYLEWHAPSIDFNEIIDWVLHDKEEQLVKARMPYDLFSTKLLANEMELLATTLQFKCAHSIFT